NFALNVNSGLTPQTRLSSTGIKEIRNPWFRPECDTWRVRVQRRYSGTLVTWSEQRSDQALIHRQDVHRCGTPSGQQARQGMDRRGIDVDAALGDMLVLIPIGAQPRFALPRSGYHVD